MRQARTRQRPPSASVAPASRGLVGPLHASRWRGTPAPGRLVRSLLASSLLAALTVGCSCGDGVPSTPRLTPASAPRADPASGAIASSPLEPLSGLKTEREVLARKAYVLDASRLLESGVSSASGSIRLDGTLIWTGVIRSLQDAPEVFEVDFPSAFVLGRSVRAEFTLGGKSHVADISVKVGSALEIRCLSSLEGIVLSWNDGHTYK